MFGERLRALREEKNMTQKQLAAAIGVSPRMVSFYECGDHLPRDEVQLIKIARCLDTTTDYLLGYSDLRSRNQLDSLYRIMEQLPAAAQRSVLDYADFLKSKTRKTGR